MGSHFRESSLVNLDHSRPEWQYMEEIREGLRTQLGGTTTFSEEILIERAAIMALRLKMFDTRIIEGEPLLHKVDQNYIIAWNVGLTRVLRALGIRLQRPHKAPRAKLANVMAELGLADASAAE